MTTPKQLNLGVETRAIARHKDPGSSHAAAREHITSGRHASQMAAVLDALRAAPGSTSSEIADALRCDRYTPSRRLPDLLRAGLVSRGDSRQCRVSGRMCVTWWPQREAVQPTEGGQR